MTVSDEQVEALIAWLRKRGEPDSGIRYEGPHTRWDEDGSPTIRIEARVELFGSDADFIAKHFHGQGALDLADTLSRLSGDASPASPKEVTEVEINDGSIKELLTLHTELLAAKADNYQMIDGSQYDTWPDIILRAATALDRASRALSLHHGKGATHRHVKRGSEYVLIGFGKMQAEKWKTPTIQPDEDGVNRWMHVSIDMREVAIYRSVDDGSLWVRPREEFEDGRFEPIRYAKVTIERDKRMVDDLLTAAVADYNGVLAVAQEVRTDLVREFGTTDGDINEIVRKLDSLRALSQGEQS
jgi:hypothetical protein